MRDVRAPTWSDVNEHDPGLTLLALFAWLAVGLVLARRLRDLLRQPPGGACHRRA